MTNYRRNYVAGGTYFFTVALADRQSALLVDEIEHLRQSLQTVRQHQPFTLVAMVVLPEHLQCIWTLSEGDSDYATRWRKLKARFSMSLPKGEDRSLSRERKHERGIWQRRYWEHTIRDERDFRQHVDYIHFNPVKHGLVTAVADWPHSTFRAYTQRGLYPLDWGGANKPNDCSGVDGFDL